MMKRLINMCLVVTFSIIFASCASIMNGTTQSMGISSSPPGAKVTIDNSDKGQTPIVVNLTRKDNHVIMIELAGYEKYSATFTRSASGWVWGNLAFGGLIGLAVDAISGGMYKLTPTQVEAMLQKNGNVSLEKHDNLYLAVVLQPDNNWEKVGQLTPKR